MSETQGKLAPLVQVKDKPIVRAIPDAPLTTRPVTDIGVLIAQAIEKGTNPDDMGKLYELLKDMRKWNAETAFNAALLRFKQDCPPIPRRRANAQFKHVNRNGVEVPSRYAAMDDIEATISEPLAVNGLSYTFGDSEVDNGKMTMTFLLSHVDGHTRTSKMTFPVAESAGAIRSKQSAMQIYGGTVTYLKRYLVSAGLALKNCDDDDNDGNEPEKVSELVSEAQVRELLKLSADVGANVPKFLAIIDVAKFSDIKACDFERCMRVLGTKRKRKA